MILKPKWSYLVLLSCKDACLWFRRNLVCMKSLRIFKSVTNDAYLHAHVLIAVDAISAAVSLRKVLLKYRAWNRKRTYITYTLCINEAKSLNGERFAGGRVHLISCHASCLFPSHRRIKLFFHLSYFSLFIFFSFIYFLLTETWKLICFLMGNF